MSHRKSAENSDSAIEVHVTRGNLTESVHLVDAVVVDHHGKVKAEFGQGGQILTYPRSAIKMIQAVSFVESGAYFEYGLTEQHLAIACASHNGEKAHSELVLNWLAQIQYSEEHLICGAHHPYDEKTAHELIQHKQKPQRRHNNCSGKHVGILSTIKKLGWRPQDYGSYDHDLQKRLRKTLSQLSGEDMDRAPWGLDGCSIPTYGMSLMGLARALRFLIPEGDTLFAERKEALNRIREAVLKHPYFIGGTGDFCTDFITRGEGRLIVKSGAEGVHAGVLLNEGLALALKVRDGNARASRVAMAALLRTFKGISESEFLQLSDHTQPAVKNWEGQTVGKIFVPRPVMG